MSGVQLAERVREQQSYASTPMVLLSSDVGLHGECGGGSSTFAGRAIKPVRRTTLLRLIATALPRRLPPIDGADVDDAPGIQVRVLAAEDNALNRMVLEVHLSSLGCEFTTVADGAEALQALGRHRFDVVLMDCQMPVLDGFEVTRRVRADIGSGHADIPIIALTAYALPEDRARCLAAGMSDHLAKPFRRADLAKMLAKWSAASVDVGSTQS